MQWVNNFYRYNKGSEEQFWLSNYSRKPILKERKSVDSVFITNPFVSVIGSLQTEMLNEFSKDDRIKNGFMDRILFISPDDFKKPYYSNSRLDSYFTDQYSKYIHKLLELKLSFIENESIESTILSFSPEAEQLFTLWYNNNADQINDPDTLEFLRGVYSKLDVYMPRIALILQLSYWACDEEGKDEICLRSVRGAIRVIEYFRETAIKIYYQVSKHESSSENKKGITNKEIAFTLKTLGHSIPQIAEILKLTRQQAYNYFKGTLQFT